MNTSNLSLTLITHHFNGHERANMLLNALSSLDSEVRQKIDIIIVDDCSESSVLPEEYDLNVKFYRILDDISWNQAGARNLGCFMAQTPWLLFFDIDQLPLESCISLILATLDELDENSLYYFYVSDFIDSNLNELLTVHPNTFLVNSYRFRLNCMYDEDFAGNYGFEDLYLPYVWEHFGGNRKILGNFPLFRDTKFKTVKFDRSSTINNGLATAKINTGIKKPSRFIRFNWELQATFYKK